MTTYYVTAYAIPLGATSLPKFKTDMGKFETQAAAEAHAAGLRGPATGFAEVRVEQRPVG